METCETCGGSGQVYTEADVEQLYHMIMLAFRLNPPVPSPWEEDAPRSEHP